MTNTSFGLSVALPPGYVGEKLPNGWVAAKSADRDALASCGLFDGSRAASAGEATDLGGRGSLRRLRLPSGPALVRQYLHGGLLRSLTGARFYDRERPFRELAIAAAVLEAGIATPEPIAALTLRSWPGYRLFFVSREISGKDLASTLEMERDPEKRRELLRRVGKAIAKFHDAGFFHFDLHPKNVFIGQPGGEVYFLDFDRSQHFPALPREKRIQNLERFFRYGLRAQALRGEAPWSREEIGDLLEAYEPQNTLGLRGDIDDVFRQRAKLHRLGWRLERLF